MLPEGLAAEIDTGAWTIPPIFEVLRRLGNIPEDDYRRTFNLGIGMVLAVSRRASAARRRSASQDGRAVLRDRQSRAAEARRAARGVPMKKRLGILLSGRGSNFEAIADSVAAGSLDAEIAVVIAQPPGGARVWKWPGSAA